MKKALELGKPLLMPKDIIKNSKDLVKVGNVFKLKDIKSAFPVREKELWSDVFTGKAAIKCYIRRYLSLQSAMGK